MQTQIFKGVQTHVRTENGALIGTYRQTDVAKKEGNLITLTTGGWKTNTTKTRMNQFANNFCESKFQVYQKNYEWFVATSHDTYLFDSDSIRVEI